MLAGQTVRVQQRTGNLHGVWPWFLVAAAMGCGLVAASLIQPWVEPDLLYRDLFITQGIRRYAGFISNVGVFLWCSTAAICLFAAATLHGVEGASRHAGLLAYFGSLSGILLVDDFFMLHEGSAKFLGMPSAAVLGLLMVILLAGLGFFRHDLVRLGWPLLIGALIMFGAAVVGDVINDSIPDPKPGLLYVAEDAPKLVGIVFWACFFIRASLISVIATRRA